MGRFETLKVNVNIFIFFILKISIFSNLFKILLSILSK
jgi:hypothetical protein